MGGADGGGAGARHPLRLRVLFEPGGPAGPRPLTTGRADHRALTVPLAGGNGLRAHAGAGPLSAPALTLLVPDATGPRVGVRRHGDAVTYRHRSGRVLATSADGTTLLANLRTTTR
ncbi:hypothetical protein ACFCX4_06925 [Kitasatospora sp. NPDC056327]|uniref:hypothetical protein n=1 Tax=Kitasatospora sp. NPDC056327 TaxID=3345785 RepID=UPI0035E12374